MIKIAYSPVYQLSLPENHRFPMLKYELIPKQLIHEGVITNENLFEPKICKEDIILLTHDEIYWNNLKILNLTDSEIRKIGFPLSSELILREQIIMQGTIDCALFALQNGCALNVAGGTHHAFTNRGEGFCLLNDLAIAANYLLHKNLASKILIIDLDVHQGNGTAQIFSNKNAVYTLSMHGKNNYPFHKETSDLDIELEDGIDDKSYLELLEKNLDIAFAQLPDFVFYQCGVDILQTDKYGKLNVTMNGCKKRDEIIFETCKNKNLPIVSAMGGGYSTKISDIVNAHCNTFKVAFDVYSSFPA